MTGPDFRDLALALDGTIEVGHFNRKAFRVRRIFATLAPDEQSANIRLTPEEQEHYASVWPGLFAPLPNKWGARGWTRLRLETAEAATIRAPLLSAWTAASRRKP